MSTCLVIDDSLYILFISPLLCNTFLNTEENKKNILLLIASLKIYVTCIREKKAQETMQCLFKQAKILQSNPKWYFKSFRKLILT